jgi:hypothetical protein
MKGPNKSVLLALAVLCVGAGIAVAKIEEEETLAPGSIMVGTKEAPPFGIKNEEGK